MILPLNKFGLNFQLLSTNSAVSTPPPNNVLKSSSSDTIKTQLKSTSCGTNIQYDIYQINKQVLKVIQQENTNRLSNQLISQGYIISFLLKPSLKAPNSLRSSTQSKLPKNISNFPTRYLNNTRASRYNRQKWKLSRRSLYIETQLSISLHCLNLERYQRYLPFFNPPGILSPVLLLVSNFVLIFLIMQVENTRNTVTLYRNYHLITMKLNL